MEETAQASFRAGRLDEALRRLQNEVRAKPAESPPRIFLAQLLMVLGQWQRASTQLAVLREMSALHLPMAQTYELLIESESVRAEVFAGRRAPLVLGDPPTWIAGLLQALALEAAGELQAAAKARAEALESAPASQGSVNGDAFEWLADADSRLGPVLEVILKGGYYWVPLERLKGVEIEAPSDIRDLVWIPAQLTLSNGGEAAAFIPVRYTGTEGSPDDRLRLARGTSWQALGEDSYAGLGQRVLATDQREYALLDVRHIEFESAGEEPHAT